MKDIFTVSEVASFCKVSERVAGKWGSCGRLPSYRIPETKEFRITREHLIKFMTEHGYALDGLEDDAKE